MKNTSIREDRSMDLDKSGIRHINQLIKDIEIIEVECTGATTGKYDNSKLDEFQRYKRQLNDILIETKQSIKTKQGIEERLGTNTESIKLKNKIKNNLQEAKRLHKNLEDVYNESQHDYDVGDGDLSLQELASRQELVALMQQDLEFTQNEFEPRSATSSPTASGFTLAQTAKKRRKKQRDQGLMSSEPQPLTSKQQAFIQESIERDAQLGEKLDIIKQGVKTLGAIAGDINNEFEVQAVMLDEVEQKMDGITEKLESRNEQIKKLLDSSGGATRWCPVLILCVILITCIGYLYNAFFA